MNHVAFLTENQELIHTIEAWEQKLLSLDEFTITAKRNKQNRSIKEILGHLADSASNNTHRIVHLQYQDSPLLFPDYAFNGNNDRWIKIQDYQSANWANLVQHWKYLNLHFAHVVEHVDQSKYSNTWISGEGRHISLSEMIAGYYPHFRLHMNEIGELCELSELGERSDFSDFSEGANEAI